MNKRRRGTRGLSPANRVRAITERISNANAVQQRRHVARPGSIDVGQRRRDIPRGILGKHPGGTHMGRMQQLISRVVKIHRYLRSRKEG